MALLVGAAALREARDWTISVGHVDHGIRSTGRRDADFVRAMAEANGLAFEERRVDVPSLARAQHRSIEDAAREARYAALEEIASGIGEATLIVTAHTADDNAETIVLNLVRGSGIAGLRGMPVRRGRIVRPLLGVRRAALRGWLRDAGIGHVEDETNLDLRHARNRVRAEVIPALERLNPAVVDALLRLAFVAADDDQHLNAAAAEELERRRLPGEELRLEWRDPPPRALGRRVIRLAARDAPSLERVEALLDAAEGTGGGLRIELGQGATALVRGKIISFSRSGD